MTDMDGAPPTSPPSPSHDDDGGFNYSGVRDHLLWALSYGVASAIALRTIDALTCKRTTNQPAGSEKPKEKEKEKLLEEKTTTTINPTVCHVNVFPPSVLTTITNSKDSSTLVISTKKEDDQTATASSTPKKVSENNGGNTAAVAASNGGVLGLFSRPQAKAQLPPPICKHALDFYYDCLHVSSEKKCEGYIDLTEKCHQMGPKSADNSNIFDDGHENPTLRPPAALLHMSYRGCREKYRPYAGEQACKKYQTFISETSQNS